MLLLRLWNYIRGYVIILIEGYFLEKFINISTHRQIFLWDVKRQKNCSMTAKISIKGFRLLRPIAKKTGCRVNIVKKRGLPFLLSRYKKRKAFVLGSVVFILMFFVMTSFIWKIEITGNSKIDKQVLEQKLSTIGIRPGRLKYNIDTSRAANDMMLSIKEIAWISIAVKGTKIKVEISERTKPPELVPKDTPCDIIATKDGIIQSITVKEGQEQVKAGDTVKKGQVLISGTISSKTPEIAQRVVHALGEVKARTWYEKDCDINEEVTEKQRTGKIKNRYSLVLFNKILHLPYGGKEPFEKSDKVEIRKALSIGENLVFPFEFIKDSYYEYSEVNKKLDQEEATQLAADNAYKEAAAEIPDNAEIVKTYFTYTKKEDDKMQVKSVIECVENIDTKKEIGGY
jgi:similar to stage IV sporulation protein